MYFSSGVQLQAALSALPASKLGQFLPFDALFYSQTYMQGYAGTLTPVEHFVQYGAPSLAKPNATFDPAFYKLQYDDLRTTNFDSADLLYHFMMYGLDEGRAPNASFVNFDGEAYLAQYPDVAAYVDANLADFNGSRTNGAIAHYVKFGAYQGFEPVFNDGPATYTVTTSADVAMANIFNAMPGYTPGGNDLVNSLQNEDVLTGTGENPTLNVQIGSINDAAEAIITPTLNGIQTVNVDVAGGDLTQSVGLSFQSATGVESLNVTRIVATNQDVVFQELQDSTTNVSLSNATRDGTVEFNWAEGALEGTEDALNLTLNNVRQDALVVNQGSDNTLVEDAAEDEGYGFETINVAVTAATNVDIVFLAANQEEQRAAAEAGADRVTQTINVDAQTDLEINALHTPGAEFINLTATGDVVVTGNERTNADGNLNAGLDAAEASRAIIPGVAAGFHADELEVLTIDGSGDVTINGLTTDADGTNAVEIAGGAMTGDLAIRVMADIATHEDSTLESGSGNDEIITHTGSEMDITTNDGDDTIRIQGDAGNMSDNELDGTKDLISTGAGADTVLVGFVDYNGTLAAGEDSYADIDTAAGADTVTIARHQSGNINTGSEDDTVTIGGNLDAATVATETGDDTVTVGGDITVASMTTAEGADTVSAGTITGTDLNTGSEDDSVTSAGNVSDSAIATEDGNDTVTIGGSLTGSTIATADGNDTVTIAGNAEDADLGLQGNTAADIDLGTGADVLTIGSALVNADLGADVVAGSDAETGNDDGQDTVTVFGNMLGTASITTQAGDDTVTIHGELGVVRGDFVGDVTPDASYVDGAPVSEHDGSDYKQPGKTADNSHFDVTEAATISTGEGNDTVATGSLRSAAQYNDNLIAGNGDADDTITIVGASITTGAGVDTVTLTQSDEFGALVAEGASVDTGADNDTVTIHMDTGVVLEADNAKTGLLTDREGATALVQNTAGALLTTGAGDDTITINGDMDSNDGDDDLLVVDRGAVLDGGADTDSLTIRATDDVEVVASKAYQAVAGDNDDITDGSDIAMGGVNAEDAADGQGGYITGIETITLVAENSLAPMAYTPPGLLDESLALTDDVNNTPAVFDIDVEQIDTDLQTLNLVANEQRELLGDTTVVNGEVVTDVAVGETGSTETTGTFNNLYVAGAATTFEVDNFRSDVELNLAAYEVNGVTGVPVDSGLNDGEDNDIFTAGSELEDNCAIDVTVTVNMDAQAPSLATVGAFLDDDANRSFTLNLTANADLANQTGEANYDVRIVSQNQFMQNAADAVVTDADVSDDLLDSVDAGEDVQLDARYARDIIVNVTTGASHYINVADTFGNVGDLEWDVYDENGTLLGTVDALTAADATNMFADGDYADWNNDGDDTTQNETETSLTVNSDVAGQVIAVEFAHADTITLNGASDFFLNVDASNNYTITTGSGDDVVWMNTDVVNSDDVLDGGAGHDILIVSAGATDLTNVSNFEELVIMFNEGEDDTATVDVPSNLFDKVTIVNWPALDSEDGINDEGTPVETVGTHTVNLTVTNVSGVADDLVIEADEDVANLAPDFCRDDLNDRHSDRLVLNVNTTADNAVLGAAATDLSISVNVSDGTAINLTTDTAENVAITATVSNLSANLVDATNGGDADGELQIVTNDGDVESITLDGDAGNELITVTVDNTWAADNLFIDARQVTDAGNGNLFDGSAETNASLTIHGTTEDAATLERDGDDTIIGGRVNDFLFGEGGNDVIRGGLGVDTIDGGAGDDVIYGQLGADMLTGGAGVDTFVIGGVNGADIGADAASDESDQASKDTITDFTTGVDKLEINLGTVLDSAADNFVDLSSFANVTTVGDGDDSLAGTTTDRVQGDMYYTSSNGGQFVMDVDGNGDITAQDIAINSANVINAADMVIRLNTGAGNDTVRLGQGVDIIDGGADDDTLVIVGAMGAAEIATYGADISDNGTMNTIADYGLQNVVDENELLVQRTQSEANAGDTIQGGAGYDTLHVFGNTNLAVVNGGAALNVEQLTIHSTVTLTDVQLAALDVVLFDDNTDHTLTIISSVTGLPLSTDQINAIIEDSGVVLQSADGAPVTVGGVLWYIGGSENVEVTEDVNTLDQPNPVTGNVFTNENVDAGFNAITINGVVVTGPVAIPVWEGMTLIGTMTFQANGDFSFLLNDAGVQALADGQTMLEQFAYNAVKVVDDEIVAKASTAFVNVTINGTTEIGTIDAGIVGASVTEAGGVANGVVGVPTVGADALYAAGDVAIANYDDFEVVVSGDATYGSYTVAADGVWEYTLNNDDAAVQALNVGDTLTDTITLESVDGVTQEVTITINGANDAPTMEVVEVTNNSVTLLAADVDSTEINLVESLNGETALNNGEDTTFVVEAQAAMDVTDLIATDGTDAYDLNTQVVLGTLGDDTFYPVPSTKDAILFGFDGNDTFNFVDDGVANTITIADWAHGEDGTVPDLESDTVWGSLGTGDVLNVLFDEAMAQTVQTAPVVVATTYTPASNDTVTGSAGVVAVTDSGADTVGSFTVNTTTISDGDTIYISGNSVQNPITTAGTNPAAVTGGFEVSYTYNSAISAAENMVALLNALDVQFGATPGAVFMDEASGTYTFTINDAVLDEAGDLTVLVDDHANDYTAESGTDGTVTFAEHYDLGDTIQVTVGSDTATYIVSTAGGVAGTMVAASILSQIDSLTVNDVDYAGASLDVTGLVLTVNSDNSNATGDGLVTITSSITQDPYQLYDGTGISTKDSSQRVTGSSGSDVIITGAGVDVMTGGDGADTFVFETGDSVFSSNAWYVVGEDSIDAGTEFVDYDLITDFTSDDVIVLPSNVINSPGDDWVDNQQVEIYYGTIDASGLFTVTGTPDDMNGVTGATHTLMAFDDNNLDDQIGTIVLTGVFEEDNWSLVGSTMSYGLMPA